MATKQASEVVAAAANESVDSWRAAQGLPPIDRSKKSRSLEASIEATKPKKDTD